MNKSIIPGFGLLSVLFFTGCASTVALHDFSYHGTDAVLANHSFFYVAQGVVGKATTEYDLIGGSGGFVRNGLVADAKTDLAEQSPLGPNQTYGNMAIDVITENIGYRLGGTHVIKRIRLTAVVSADIIEFGEPRFDAQSNSVKSGVLPSSVSQTQEPMAPTAVSANAGGAEREENQPVSSDDSANAFASGDFVWFEYRGSAMYGYVEESRGERAKVKFRYQDAEKSLIFAIDEIFRTKEEVGRD